MVYCRLRPEGHSKLQEQSEKATELHEKDTGGHLKISLDSGALHTLH